MPTWYVYILRCGDGSLYTGISTDVEKRLKLHACGKGAAYTRSHLPVALAWKRRAASGTAARKREVRIKRLSKQEKEDLIAPSLPGP